MERSGGWRDYQRETNRVMNSCPEERRRPDRNRMLIAKHSNSKETVYMCFLRKIGRKRFLFYRGENYDDKNAGHKEIMTGYFKEFKTEPEFQEQLAEIQGEVERHNANKQKLTEARKAKRTLMREQRHQNPAEFERLRTEHTRALAEARTSSSYRVPPSINDIFIDADLEAYRAQKKETAKTNLISFFSIDRNSTENPLCSGQYKIHLITVMPYNFVWKYKLNQLSSYPAEVGITTFNFPDGLIKSSSRIVMMDNVWYYQMRSSDEVPEEKNQFKHIHGIDEDDEGVGAVEPFDMFQWLQNCIEMEPNAKILCDQKQYNFVYYGLKCMAKYTGHTAQQYFKDKIAANLMGIQDFTSNILAVAPLNRERDNRWSDSDIDRQFMYHDLIPRHDQDSYCNIHDDDRFAQAKYYCVRAQNARLMHNFFRIMKANKLHGFTFRESTHELCLPGQGNPRLPEIIEAPVFTRDEVQDSAQHQQDHFNGEDSDEEDEDSDDTEDEEDLASVYFREAHENRPESPENHQAPTESSRFLSSSTYANNMPSVRSRDLRSPPRQQPVEIPDRVYPPQPLPVNDVRLYQQPRRAEIPNVEDWENPVLFDICPRAEGLNYIRTAQRPNDKSFRGINLDD